MTEVIITSSVLIIALLVLRRLLKGRIDPRLQYTLWLLVALRLLIPFSIPSPTSIMNTQPAAVVQQAITQTVAVSPEIVVPQQPVITPDPVVPIPRAKPDTDWIKVIWVGGSTVVGLYFAAANLTFYKKLKKQRRPLENTNCSLPVYLVEEIPSPCLFGLLHPAVYITPQAASDTQMLEHVLTHEYCHYRQHDHIWSLVRILCLTIHWFNPLVWAAALCSRTDCELSCDRLVVKSIGNEQKVVYGRTLVELVQHKQKLAYIACTATTMAAKSNKTKERVTAIIKSPKTAIPILVAVLICVALLISVTFTGQADKQPPTEEEVIELLQKAEAVYQPGNQELLTVDRNEVMLGDLYYDEIGNYEQSVTELFTENGINQIENTYCLNNKLIEKQDGKVYRIASVTDSTATVFYDDINSVELVEHQENRFAYEIIHTSRPRWGEGEKLTSQFILMRNGDKLMIESFCYPLANESSSAKPDNTDEYEEPAPSVEEPPLGFSEPEWMAKANAILEENFQKLLNSREEILAMLNQRLLSFREGTFEEMPNHHAPWREDFPSPQDVKYPLTHDDFVVRLTAYESIDETSWHEGGLDIWVRLDDQDHYMVLIPTWFGSTNSDETTLGFSDSRFYKGELPFDFGAWQEVAQMATSQPAGALQAGIVYSLGDEVSSFPMQRTEGRQPELDRWNIFIHSDEISRFDARTMSEVRGVVTPQNAQQILRILQNAQLTIMQDMGNPHTGGSMELIAYNANGNELFHCIYDQYWFSVQFMEEDEAYVFDGSVVGWNQLEALLDVGQPLDNINAELTVDRILESLILNADGNLSFVLPDQLPVPDNSINLYATLNLTYKLNDGSYRVDSLLDWATGWQPGQVYSARWQPASGEELTEVMLRMAYMTDLGGGQYKEFHADYMELTEPLPIGRYATEQGIELKTDGRNAQIAYTGSNGQITRLTMTLPDGVTLKNDTPTIPMLTVHKNGEEIGSLSLQQYGTTDRQALLSVNTAATTPPMQIYSPIALSNHVDYSSGYRVVDSTSNACRAVCRMRYQDISNYGGNTPNAPWLEQDVILSFDLEGNPLFLAVHLNPDKLTANELEKWALRINFDS